MNNFIKNIVLLVISLFLSYFTANYFGSIYGYFSPQYDDTLIGLPKTTLLFVDGLPFAYIFFTTFIFKTFGWGNKDKWMWALLIPALLFFAAGDLKHFYLPVILGLIAYGLSKLTLLAKSKLSTR